MATESSGSITLSNVDSVTNRTNLGLGSLATQDANAVALTGGSLTGTEIDLKSSGTTLYASNGSTSLISESSGTVTVDNVTLGSNVIGFRVEVADVWNLTANKTSVGDITANLARDTTNSFGSAMTESSGIFTFPSTGYYLIFAQAQLDTFALSSTGYAGIVVHLSTDGGSSFSEFNRAFNDAAAGYNSFSAISVSVIDVTNTTNFQIKFEFQSGSSSRLLGGTGSNVKSSFKFIRIAGT